MKHKYHKNEKNTEYQKTKALNCYYKYSTSIEDGLFVEVLTNMTEGI